MWSLEKGKLIQTCKGSHGSMALTSMTCNFNTSYDTSTSQIAVTGHNIVRTFKCQDGFLKQTHQTKVETVIIRLS
jgi:hypothetical protein